MKDYEKIIEILDLEPLEKEGGMFRRTYSSPGMAEGNHMGSAIYYMLTGDAFSYLHILKTDEIYHFYSGDPVKLVELNPDGSFSTTILGPDILAGHQVQHMVPAGVWQGSYLLEDSEYALLGTTMSPGFQESDFTAANREELLKKYPEMQNEIIKLTGDITFN